MTRTAIGVGTGKLLTRRSYLKMINPRIGFGSSTKNKNKYCDRCQQLNRYYGYGLGVVRNGAWILQDPLFGGYAAIESYLPAQKISIALAETFDQSSFSAYRRIHEVLEPVVPQARHADRAEQPSGHSTRALTPRLGCLGANRPGTRMPRCLCRLADVPTFADGARNPEDDPRRGDLRVAGRMRRLGWPAGRDRRH